MIMSSQNLRIDVTLLFLPGTDLQQWGKKILMK